jgi:ATP-dependent DNA ligase
MGLEGIVSKKRGTRYKSGEVDTWLKTKTFTVGEFEVIGADLSPTGAPVAILARRDELGLHYVGDAFITLTAADREDFRAYVEANTVEAPALPLKRRGTWLRPGLAATARHLRGEGMLSSRHAQEASTCRLTTRTSPACRWSNTPSRGYSAGPSPVAIPSSSAKSSAIGVAGSGSRKTTSRIRSMVASG